MFYLFWLLMILISDPQSRPFHFLALMTACANLQQIPFICLQNIMFTSLLTDKQMNRQVAAW